MRNHYDVLGVDREATHLQIQKAYHAKAYELHPDRHVQTGPEKVRLATGAMAEVNEAFRVLSDPLQRRIYDSYLDRKSGSSAARRAVAGKLDPMNPLLIWGGVVGIVLVTRLIFTISQEAFEVKLLWTLASFAILGAAVSLYLVLRDMGR